MIDNGALEEMKKDSLILASKLNLNEEHRSKNFNKTETIIVNNKATELHNKPKKSDGFHLTFGSKIDNLNDTVVSTIVSFIYVYKLIDVIKLLVYEPS